MTLEATNHANRLLGLDRALQSGILSGELLVERLRRRAEVLGGVLGTAEGTSSRPSEGEGVSDVDCGELRQRIGRMRLSDDESAARLCGGGRSANAESMIPCPRSGDQDEEAKDRLLSSS